MKYIITMTEKETGAVVDKPIECDGVAIVTRCGNEKCEVIMHDMTLAALIAAIHEDEHLKEAAEIVLGFERWKRSPRGKWKLWKARKAERRS